MSTESLNRDVSLVNPLQNDLIDLSDIVSPQSAGSEWNGWGSPCENRSEVGSTHNRPNNNEFDFSLTENEVGMSFQEQMIKMLGDINTNLNTKIAELNANINQKFESWDSRIQAVENTSSNNNQRLVSLENKVEAVCQRVEPLENKIPVVEQKVETLNSEIKVTKSEMNDRLAKIDNKFEETNLKFEKVHTRLNKCEERQDETDSRINREVGLGLNKTDDNFKSISDRPNVIQTNNELKKLNERTVALENVIKSRSVNENLIDEYIKKQEQHEQETIVMTNKIKNLEIEKELINAKLSRVETKLSELSNEIKQKSQNTCVVNSDSKSVSNISANAELFLTEFNNEVGSVHPMIYLKFAKKFIEVSGDNWEIQLLYLIKYLKGEPESWARQHVDRFNNFDQFEIEFKRKFWGHVRQREFECDLMGNGSFKVGLSKSDVQSYVMNYYEINKMLDKPISMEMFLKHICRHLPESSAAAVQMIMTIKEITSEQELEAMCRNLSNIHDKESLPVNKQGQYESKTGFKYNNHQGNSYQNKNSRPNASGNSHETFEKNGRKVDEVGGSQTNSTGRPNAEELGGSQSNYENRNYRGNGYRGRGNNQRRGMNRNE